ncbi:MAG: ATP-binding cassette domain-containing protein [Chromatiales bacterium]|nr:ATP-binding cassette domain-containing protein [Chromatiales bacterium]
MPDIIDIRNATVYRGDTLVFDRLSLTVAAGEHTAILGPNGAGKSTLLKLLSRDIYPVAAEDSRVLLYGEERGSIWELRAHLGIVSADQQREYSAAALGLHVVLSGLYSSVGVWQHQHYEPAQIERARVLLAELGVAGLAGRPFGTLSTGEQRRCLLARALINDPDTLVLDEPTSGLDLKACFQYLELVRDLMRAGKNRAAGHPSCARNPAGDRARGTAQGRPGCRRRTEAGSAHGRVAAGGVRGRPAPGAAQWFLPGVAWEGAGFKLQVASSELNGNGVDAPRARSEN